VSDGYVLCLKDVHRCPLYPIGVSGAKTPIVSAIVVVQVRASAFLRGFRFGRLARSLTLRYARACGGVLVFVVGGGAVDLRFYRPDCVTMRGRAGALRTSPRKFFLLAALPNLDEQLECC